MAQTLDKRLSAIYLGSHNLHLGLEGLNIANQSSIVGLVSGDGFLQVGDFYFDAILFVLGALGGILQLLYFPAKGLDTIVHGGIFHLRLGPLVERAACLTAAGDTLHSELGVAIEIFVLDNLDLAVAQVVSVKAKNARNKVCLCQQFSDVSPFNLLLA